MSSPAGSSSGSRWPARWRRSRGCCCWTSPFSALDENLRGEMRALVTQLHRSLGMTTVLVTHDRADSHSRWPDRVAVMFGGQIAQTGTPQEVYDHPVNRRVADYFGDCVYLSGQISDHLFCCEQLPFSLSPPLPCRTAGTR